MFIICLIFFRLYVFEVDFSGTSQIYSNSFAFLLLDTANLPHCWGRSGYGGARRSATSWAMLVSAQHVACWSCLKMASGRRWLHKWKPSRFWHLYHEPSFWCYQHGGMGGVLLGLGLLCEQWSIWAVDPWCILEPKGNTVSCNLAWKILGFGTTLCPG